MFGFLFFLTIQSIVLVSAHDAWGSFAKLYNAADLQTSRNFSLGTNPHLKEIYLGRCYAVFGSGNLGKLSIKGDPMVLCPDLWDLFASGFRYMNDSEILPSSFLPFFSHPTIMASLFPGTSNALFWSGVSSIIPTYSGATGQFVMETSSLVGIVGDLMWCGSSADPSGFDYKSCIWGDYNTTGDNQWHGSWVSYWAAASMAYAPLASGNITILLSGSPAPYRRNSFFATCELPNLTVPKITGVQVFVVPENGEPYDHCGEGSLIELVDDLVSIGIDSSLINCTDDPPLIQLIQCLHSPVVSQCLLM